MTTQTYYFADLDTANRAIAKIKCLDLSIEAARWRIHHNLNPHVVVMIRAEKSQDTFLAYAGDALILQKHAGIKINTSVFGGQKVDTSVIDTIETHQVMADLEKAGIAVIFIR